MCLFLLVVGVRSICRRKGKELHLHKTISKLCERAETVQGPRILSTGKRTSQYCFYHKMNMQLILSCTVYG